MNKFQNNEQWRLDKLGKISASNFSKVLGGNTRHSYLQTLISEMSTGESMQFSSAATDWGKNHEDEAIKRYELATGRSVKRIGFVKHQIEDWIGCSPDGLIRETGGIEVKCPFKTENFIRYLMGSSIPKDYFAQVQGNLWVTGRKWWDFVVYDPRIKEESKQLIVRRVLRNELFIHTLEIEIPLFRNEYLNRLKFLGLIK